jgi:hypothetical protein
MLQSVIRAHGSILDLYGLGIHMKLVRHAFFMMVAGSQAENMEKSVE